MDEQPSSFANFVEPGPESVKLRKARARLELSVHAGSRHGFYQGFGDELSAAGIFVATHITKPVGETLDFRSAFRTLAIRSRVCARSAGCASTRNRATSIPAWAYASWSSRPGPRSEFRKFLEQEEALFFDED